MFGNYLKIALKVLARRMFFTFVSLFGICFTLFVLLVVAALADHQLAPRGSEKKLGRALHLDYIRMEGDRSIWASSPGYLFLDRYCRDLPHVQEMAIRSSPTEVTNFLQGERVQSRVMFVDGPFWRVMDFEFLEGGPFGDTEAMNGDRLAVINSATRQRFFGGQPAVGQDITLEGEVFRVVGVVDNVPFYLESSSADIWAPLGITRLDDYREALIGMFHGIFLAQDKQYLAEIKAEFRSRLLEVEYPDPERFHTMRGMLRTRLERVSASIMGNDADESTVGRTILYFTLGALLFMLLPAINLVNINLSRIWERSSEIGVRKAFGASSGHLVGQFMVENVILCVIGGAIGLLLAMVALKLVPSFVPGWTHVDFGLNLRIFGYALLLAVFFGLLSGVWPAWKMSRQHPVAALRGGAR
jgi:putative ABC transport system permease protein